MTEFRPFRKKRSYSLAAAIIVAAVLLSFSAYRDLFGLRNALNSAIYPFQFLASSGWKGLSGLPGGVINLINLSQENASLKQKIVICETRTRQLEELTSENSRLRAALGYQAAGRFGRRLLPAGVLGRAPSTWSSLIVIDRGTSSGIKENMTVMAVEGLVGRVVEADSFSAKIMLITDVDSDVAAVSQRSRDLGMVEGFSPLKLAMRYVSAAGDVQIGDVIVTAVSSSLFPPGIPVGKVSKAEKKEHDLFYQIEIEPAVPFSRLEEVYLVF